MQMHREGTIVSLNEQVKTEDKYSCVLWMCVSGAGWAPECSAVKWLPHSDMRQEKGVCVPLAEGRTGCRTWSMHTRWKTDLFWKDFQKRLSDNLAQISDLLLCCWNYNFSKDNLCKKNNRNERWLSPAGEGLLERGSDIALEKIDWGSLTQHHPELLCVYSAG